MAQPRYIGRLIVAQVSNLSYLERRTSQFNLIFPIAKNARGSGADFSASELPLHRVQLIAMLLEFSQEAKRVVDSLTNGVTGQEHHECEAANHESN